MKANEFLTELFDKPTEVSWTSGGLRNGTKLQDANFVVGNKSGKVRFIEYPDYVYILFDVNGQLSATGTGDEIKIFSVVANTIVKYVQQKSPEKFYFYADKEEPTRIKLYNRLSQRLLKAIPQYKLNEKPNADIDYIHYVFTKS